MYGPIKILGNSQQLSGIGTTVSDINGLGAQYVLIQHTGGGNHYIIEKTGAGVTVGTVHMTPQSFLLIKKERTNIISVNSGTDIYATSVVYQG